MNYNKYNAAIFDCDGTLLDSMPMWRSYASDLVKSLGYNPTIDLDSKCNTMDMHHAAIYMKELLNMKESAEYLVELAYDRIVNNYYDSLELKPKAISLLEELKKLNYKMIVATATPKKLVVAALKRLGVLEYFCDVISVEDYNTNKSESRIYDEALLILGSNKENSLVFEDALHAIQTCCKANYKIVGITEEVNKNELPEIKNMVIEIIDLY